MEASDETLIKEFSPLGFIGRSPELLATLRRLRRLAM